MNKVEGRGHLAMAATVGEGPAAWKHLGLSLVVGAASLAILLLRWIISPVLEARDSYPDASEEFFQTSSIGGTPSRPEQNSSILEGRFDTLSSPPSKKLSVVIPAYNEEQRLPGMLSDTLAYLASEAVKDPSFTYEVLVVDDGSTDGTGEVVRKAAGREGDIVRLCTLRRNKGKGAALQHGMLRMRGKYGLMADADGATDIGDLSRLMQSMKTLEKGGLGLVVGSRAHLETEAMAKRALHRTILMWGFHLCVKVLCSRRVRDTQCGFKLFTRATAEQLFAPLHLHRWAFDIELIYLAQRLGVPLAEVAVKWREVEGSKLITNKLDVITTSLSMLRDMVCIRLCYLLGLWTADPPAPALSLKGE